MTEKSGTALITGASSGIGATYADRLARRGYDLILVARNRERLEELASHLRGETSRSVEVAVADLTLAEDVNAVERLLRVRSDIRMLVNNAGIGDTAPLLEADLHKMEKMIALNVTTLTRLTYAAVPGFVARGGGTIINIASIVAVAPERLNGVYGGTKAFVLAFTQSLNQELADRNIRVQAVMPGAVATEFWDISGTPLSELPKEIVMSVDDVVDAALGGLDQGEVATLPALPDAADWERFEAARLALWPNLSRARPAARFFESRVAA